jgi:hypothetical protein
MRKSRFTESQIVGIPSLRVVRESLSSQWLLDGKAYDSGVVIFFRARR